MERNKISTAALFGIYVSIPSVIVTLLSDSFNLGGFLTFLLWLVKFAGSIWILLKVMKEWSADFKDFSYGAGFSFGSLTCAFSSVIVALFTWLNMAVINKENFAQKLNQAMEAMEKSMNADQLEIMEKVMSHVEEYALFGTLIYCMLFGVVASLILANFTKKENMDFDSSTNNTEEQ